MTEFQFTLPLKKKKKESVEQTWLNTGTHVERRSSPSSLLLTLLPCIDLVYWQAVYMQVSKTPGLHSTSL